MIQLYRILHKTQSYLVTKSALEAKTETDIDEIKTSNYPKDQTGKMNKNVCCTLKIFEKIKNVKRIHRKKSYPLTQSSFREKSEEGICKKTVENVNTDLENEIEATFKKHKPFLGLFYIFLNSFTFTLACTFMKYIPYVTSGQISFGRNAICVCGGLPIAIYSMKNIQGEKEGKIQLFIGALFGTTSLYFETIGYNTLPITDVATAFACVPFMTAILARLYLKELCNVVQFVALVMASCGVLLSVRLPELLQEVNRRQFDQTYLLGLAACAGGVMTSAATFVTLRKIKHIHFSVLMVWYGCLGMIENMVINGAMSAYVPLRCGRDQIIYMAICGLDFLANVFLVLAIQVENAGIISVEEASFDILVAMFFQVVLLKENLDMYNLIGATLVITSLSVLAVKNWLLILPEQTTIRERLKCLLL